MGCGSSGSSQNVIPYKSSDTSRANIISDTFSKHETNKHIPEKSEKSVLQSASPISAQKRIIANHLPSGNMAEFQETMPISNSPVVPSTPPEISLLDPPPAGAQQLGAGVSTAPQTDTSPISSPYREQEQYMQSDSRMRFGYLDIPERVVDDIPRSPLPPLVLVHDWLGSSRSWAPVIHHLTTSRRVIAVTLRGHGDSQKIGVFSVVAYARDVGGLLEYLKISEYVLCGHGLLGTLICTTVAATYQDKVCGLIVCGGIYRNRSAGDVLDSSCCAGRACMQVASSDGDENTTTLRTYGELCSRVYAMYTPPRKWTEDELEAVGNIDGAAEGCQFLQACMCRDISPSLWRNTELTDFIHFMQQDISKCCVGACRDTLFSMLGLDANGHMEVVGKKQKEAAEAALRSVTCPSLLLWGTGVDVGEEAGIEDAGGDDWVMSVRLGCVDGDDSGHPGEGGGVGASTEMESTTSKSEQKQLKEALANCVSISLCRVSGAPYSSCIWTHARECAERIDDWVDCE